MQTDQGSETTEDIPPEEERICMYCALPERLNGQAPCERFSIAHVFAARGSATKRHPLDITEETS